MDSIKDLSDINLIIKYQSNRAPIYLGELYQRFFPRVYHYCLGKVKNRDDAYDIATDTFLVIAQKIIALRDPKLFIGWLFKIAHNRCIDLLKAKQRVLKEFNFLYLTDEKEKEELEQLIQKEHLLNLLETVLQDFDEDTKQLLFDKYVNGYSIGNLEKDHQLSNSAIKMRLYRGRAKIMKRIQKN